MKRSLLLISLALCGVAGRAGAQRLNSSGFYDPETLDFAAVSTPGQYLTLTPDGRFERGRVTRTGTGGCAVTRYEYHEGTVVVRDSVLILNATSGRVRNVSPCNLNEDYEKNDVRVDSVIGSLATLRPSPQRKAW